MISAIISHYAIATASTYLPVSQPSSAASAANTAGTVTISQAAREALAAFEASASPSAGSNSVEAKLAEIKSKDAVARTADDTEYLFAHDQKLAAIRDKINANNGASTLTAEELDYQQKAGGFVNTMASLSPAEKATYDKMVASGNTAAAAGMSAIAFERATLGHTASTKDGVAYDPTSTAITPDNIVKYFSQSFSDPTGKMQSQFQALIQYLQNIPQTA